MNIGVEVEFTGLTTKDVAGAIATLWGTYYTFEPDEKHPSRILYKVVDTKWGCWVVSEDHSIRPTKGRTLLNGDEYEYMCELVTPVLDSEDLSELFRVMNLIVNMGGIVNETCGCHIHINNREDDFEWLKSLFTKALVEQRNVLINLGMPITRNKYCKLYSDEFVHKFKELNPKDYFEFRGFIYNELGEGQSIKAIRNPARYYWLNVDSIEKRNTIEFRAFNSTLSPIVLKSYIEFVKDFVG